jgi:hypothetical protein
LRAKRRRSFVELTTLDLAADEPASRLFLGRFDEAGLRLELAAAGVLAGLERRGYEDVELRLEQEAGEHRLRVFPRTGRESLIDLRLSEATLRPLELTNGKGGADVLSVLSIHWLSMQDPGAPFTPERPRLPGQVHPGLGLARTLILRLHGWAQAWGKDALVNHPEYYHNAVFYSALYRFLSPARQGRFEALRRDLAALSVAEAAWSVERGRVLEEPGGRPFRWEPGAMIAGLTESSRTDLEGESYARGVAAARAACRFGVTP